MTQEALKALIHEMEYVLSCINEEKIPFDGDDFHEALRLGKEALAQTQEPTTGNILMDSYKAMEANKTAAQPQRTWVNLTYEQVAKIYNKHGRPPPVNMFMIIDIENKIQELNP